VVNRVVAFYAIFSSWAAKIRRHPTMVYWAATPMARLRNKTRGAAACEVALAIGRFFPVGCVFHGMCE
jgi:hypothetical protein